MGEVWKTSKGMVYGKGQWRMKDTRESMKRSRELSVESAEPFVVEGRDTL